VLAFRLLMSFSGPGCASSLIHGSACGQMRAKSRPAF